VPMSGVMCFCGILRVGGDISAANEPVPALTGARKNGESFADNESMRLTALSLVLGLMGVQAAAVTDQNGTAILQACGGFTGREISQLGDRQTIVRTLPSAERHELAVAGAVHMDIPAAFFVTRLRDIVSFKRSGLVAQVGRFSNPPTLDDLAALDVSPADIEAARACRVGDCAVKLPAGAIERFRTEVDWNRSDSNRQAVLLSKRLLFEHVLGYLEAGDRALGSYDDKRRSVNAGQEIETLVEHLSCPSGMTPAESHYLTAFPRDQPRDATSFIYWSKEAFGLKSVITVTHDMVFAPTATGRTLIASKGIYSSHYLDASVSLTWLLKTEGGTGIDVLYVNRSRVDALGGPLGGLVRGIAAGRQRDGLRRELESLKARLEADWRAAPDGLRATRH
jgi:hypothetical protein